MERTKHKKFNCKRIELTEDGPKSGGTTAPTAEFWEFGQKVPALCLPVELIEPG